MLGYSFGSVMALTLASGWFDVRWPRRAGLGVKVAWTDEELTRAQKFARRPSQIDPP